MAMTAAERQKRYRERNGRNAGKRRINLIVSALVVARLDELARQHGVHKQVMLEQVILEYDLLRRNELPVELLSPEQEAERLLALVDGDVAQALERLTSEAKQSWPDFSWSRTSARQASPDYRRLRQVKQCLSKMQQPAKRLCKPPAQKGTALELTADQLVFSF